MIDQIPISEAGRESLKAFYGRRDNLLSELSESETDALLSSISYPDFLRQYGGLTEDAVQLFDKKVHGSWGIEMRALSANDALWEENPGLHLLGKDWSYEGRDYPAALWPDGNASLVRLMVAGLLPHVAPNVTPDNVALAKFNYGALDEPEPAGAAAPQCHRRQRRKYRDGGKRHLCRGGASQESRNKTCRPCLLPQRDSPSVPVAI